MVVANMDGPGRDEILRLMEQKEHIERQIQELTSVLQMNNIGMHEPLVDEDGFPRNDIDVYRVRHARHNILCLQNDHKEIMKRIEKGLHYLHGRFTGRPATGSDTGETSTLVSNGYAPMEVDQTIQTRLNNGVAMVTHSTRQLDIHQQTAIAVVNFVSPGSPAETAGFKVGDELLSFGSINTSNFERLEQIAQVMQRSVNTDVRCRVRRSDGLLLEIILKPQTWQGRGLAGFNIINA